MARVATKPTPKKSGRRTARKRILAELQNDYLDLLHTMDVITKAGAGFRSLADAWADTTTPHGKLMLTVQGGLAEFERSLIMARTQGGGQRAEVRGVAFRRASGLSAPD